MQYLFFSFVFFICVCGNGQIQQSDYARELAQDIEPSIKVIYKTIRNTVLSLHIFLPDGHTIADHRPCFIAFHGGGWIHGEPRRFYPIVYEFVSRGMVGISVEYRFVNHEIGTTVFDCVKDARSAVRFVRKHANELGVDPDCIIVCGGSASAHLAAGTALFEEVNEITDDPSISPVPNVLVLYYPVIDTSPEGFGNKLLGSCWQELSPPLHVYKGVPPTIIFHGTEDKITPIIGARAFQKVMQNMGNRCDLVINDGGAHGYMMFKKSLYDEAIQQTVLFLNTVMKNKD